MTTLGTLYAKVESVGSYLNPFEVEDKPVIIKDKNN